MADASPVLETQNLKKYFGQNTNLLDRLLRRSSEKVQAVDGVSLTLHKNECQGVIGESGCGKTTLLKTLMGLYNPTEGTVRFDGQGTASFDRSDWKSFRRNVQIIFQDPFNSLDPKLTIRETLLEPLKIHGLENRSERVYDILRQVELQPPENYLDRYPRQLSGGELQRVSIARALVLEPDVVLADEPVSMLDVSTQAAILTLLSDLVEELDVSMLYISHDLSTVSYICDTINVMYLGRIVESAPTADLIANPKHPYSEALINAVPIPDPKYDRPFTELEGAVQNPLGLGKGCRFQDRCPERMDVCEQTPASVTLDADQNRSVACHLYYDHNKGDTDDNGNEDDRTIEQLEKTQ